MSLRITTPLVLPVLVGLAIHVRANDAPNRLFVVNTGDRSVSLVDLETMKEIRRLEVSRLFRLPTPTDNSQPQEVTYHGCEAVRDEIVLGANEGRSMWIPLT